MLRFAAEFQESGSDDVTILPIRTFGDPVLKERVPETKPNKKNLNELVKNLGETMHEAPGVGLAANQVGVLKRIFVYDIDEEVRAVINPKIVWASEETEEDEEGCLSVPEVRVPVKRSTKIKAQITNLEGKTETIEAEGLLARVFQHEIDHLNGKLILDRTSREERKKAIKQINELRMGRL